MKLPNTNDAARINDDFSYMFTDIGWASDFDFGLKIRLKGSDFH